MIATAEKPVQILELFGGIGSPRCALRNLGRKKRHKKSLTSWIMEFSKKVVVVCVLLYIIIELFSVIAIWHFADTSVLTTLISETSEVLRMGVFGYMIKAGIENWQKIKKGKQESENEEGGANG